MSSNSKKLVYDPVSCIFTAGRKRHYEIREIYTSLVMNTSLHQEQFITPVVRITFPVTEGSTDMVRHSQALWLSLRGGLPALPSLYQMLADSSVHRVVFSDLPSVGLCTKWHKATDRC